MITLKSCNSTTHWASFGRTLVKISYMDWNKAKGQGILIMMNRFFNGYEGRNEDKLFWLLNTALAHFQLNIHRAEICCKSQILGSQKLLCVVKHLVSPSSVKRVLVLVFGANFFSPLTNKRWCIAYFFWWVFQFYPELLQLLVYIWSLSWWNWCNSTRCLWPLRLSWCS